MTWPLPTILALLLALPALALADDAQIKRQAVAKVQVLNDATVKKDWAKLADLTHPNVIKLAGGREKMIALMDRTIQESKENGVEILSAKVGEPSEIVRQGRELFIVVNFEIKMKYLDGKLINYGYVVGVSDDEGKNWTFVNSSSEGSIKEVLPNLPASVKLPARKAPVETRD